MDSETYIFDVPRQSLLAMLPNDINTVLDVGCSVGANGKWLKENKGVREVVGLEMLDAAAQKAEAVLDKVVVGDVENINLDYPQGYFDCIIYADVLEHLKDPWRLMAEHQKILSNKGYVLVSLPNISNWRVIASLLADRWEYSSSGTLDRTHLRFFTQKSMRKMFKLAGYEIDSLAFNRGKLSSIVSCLTLGYMGFLFTFQYYFLLRKTRPYI